MRVPDMPDVDDAPKLANHRRRRLAGSIATVLGAALLVAGCGVQGQDLPSTEQAGDSTAPVAVDPAEATVTKDQIAATDPDSPERTVLLWWRAVQSRDSEGVIDSYTKKVRDDLPEGFKFSVVSLIAPLASSAAMSIDSVDTNGKKGKQGNGKSGSGGDGADEAMLYAMIDSNAPRLAGSLALPLNKEDAEWKIDDSTFLVALAFQYNSEIQAVASGQGETTTGG